MDGTGWMGLDHIRQDETANQLNNNNNSNGDNIYFHCQSNWPRPSAYHDHYHQQWVRGIEYRTGTRDDNCLVFLAGKLKWDMTLGRYPIYIGDKTTTDERWWWRDDHGMRQEDDRQGRETLWGDLGWGIRSKWNVVSVVSCGANELDTQMGINSM